MSDPAAERLWALDLDTGGQPWQAHLIVDPAACPPDDDWPPVLTAACGEKFTSTHAGGWWAARPGSLPLAEHAIHCRADVAPPTGGSS